MARSNLAPMSSAWWLGHNCMLGFGARSQTPINILRTGECVLNLPSVSEVAAVNRLARTTGIESGAAAQGRDGLSARGGQVRRRWASPMPSELVAPPRVLECPVHLEAVARGRAPDGRAR